ATGGGTSPAPAGGSQTNMSPSATGYTWSRNRTSTSDANRSAADGINAGDLSAGVNVNPRGEGGSAMWEAAGVVWSSPKTLGSVTFVNGTIDRYHNGYFESNCKLQLTTDGSTWVDSSWTLAPSYPGSASAGGESYTFT